MFTKEDILARLQNGETTDAIAAEMAAALNEAEAEKKALDAKKVAKEKEEARALDAKRVAVDNMLDAVCDYLVASGEGDLITDIKDIETDKVIEMLDDSIKIAKSLEKLKDLEFPMFGVNNLPKAKITVASDSADKVISEFLKELGL